MSPEVDEYIAKQLPPQKEICKRVRQIIIDTLPHVKEQMKWGVPSYKDGAYYFVALKGHVNLGFSLEGLGEKERALFDGGGTTMKHLKINTIKQIDLNRIITLLKLVDKKGDHG